MEQQNISKLALELDFLQNQKKTVMCSHFLTAQWADTISHPQKSYRQEAMLPAGDR